MEEIDQLSQKCTKLKSERRKLEENIHSLEENIYSLENKLHADVIEFLKNNLNEMIKNHVHYVDKHQVVIKDEKYYFDDEFWKSENLGHLTKDGRVVAHENSTRTALIACDDCDLRKPITSKGHITKGVAMREIELLIKISVIEQFISTHKLSNISIHQFLS